MTKPNEVTQELDELSRQIETMSQEMKAVGWKPDVAKKFHRVKKTAKRLASDEQFIDHE